MPEMKKMVIIESPLNAPTPAGIERNIRYARACMLDSLRRGEAPYVSHLLYTQVLDDNNPEERMLGLEAGLAWGRLLGAIGERVCYTDFGTSGGMKIGAREAVSVGQLVVERKLIQGHNLSLRDLTRVCGDELANALLQAKP